MKIMKKKKKAGVAHEEQKKKRHSKQKCMKKHKKAVSRQALQQNEARKKNRCKKTRTDRSISKGKCVLTPLGNQERGSKNVNSTKNQRRMQENQRM